MRLLGVRHRVEPWILLLVDPLRWMSGPHVALPRPLDALAERWARLRPRVRALLVAFVVLGLVLGVRARVQATDARWGGTPVTVLVALEDIPVGAAAAPVERRALPPAAIPARAVDTVAPGARVAFAIPAGSILTDAHFDPRGPAAGLPAELRAVPVPAEPGWGLVAGGWVDVWVLGSMDAAARLVGRSRPVLDVRTEGSALTALVGLHADEVAAATEGLAVGRVLLTHAPPPQEPVRQ